MSVQAVAIYLSVVLSVVLGAWLGRAREWVETLEARLLGDEAGQSMVEYAIVVALIAVAALGAIQALGGGINQIFQNLLGTIQGLGR